MNLIYRDDSCKNRIISPVKIEDKFFSFEIDEKGDVISEEEIKNPGTSDRLITPGLIDLQVNGFAGVDFNKPELDLEAFNLSLQTMLSTGVTSFLPTICSETDKHLRSCFIALKNALSNSELARTMVLGYHLEGPFLSKEHGYCGAHKPEVMLAANFDLFEEWQKVAGGKIKMITVAPEIQGVLTFIQKASHEGIIVAIGHTTAGFELIRKAVDAGAVLSTHLGNGTAASMSKHDNPILAQLSEDQLYASFIADGHHLSKEQLKVYLRAKEANRTLLITDGTKFSGLNAIMNATNSLGVRQVLTTLAPSPKINSITNRPEGSAATLDQCVRQILEWFDFSIDEIVPWASLYPKQLLNSVKKYENKSKKAEFVKWIKIGGTWWIEQSRSGPFVYKNKYIKK